ncbi:MAG: UDP-N-acetylmuramoyl-tripeptide--D-alanyl-D-alanine ligase [Acetobacteraceae bacterium]|nr:UDP-N-acetylmuramoyl-tripeptide--D-alanyl-D-alanine ligase [Acetobacteraceae bacterium]
MTALWTPSELRAATGGLLRVPFSATGVSIDTRTLKPGDLFVALVGESDGHAWVRAALDRGAAGALVHTLPPDVPDDAPLLAVKDTLEGLRALAAFARARFGGKLVAVTGSVGKTTTKEMLRAVLAAHGRTWAAEASHNNHWGLPLTLARIQRAAEYCVAEIGMNHAGEISPLARLARPHAALITNVERVHVGHLGGIDAVADEKLSIQDGLEDGTLVLPRDSAMYERLRAGARHTVRSFGRHEAADDRLLSATADAAGTTLAAEIAGIPVTTRLAAPGAHMALNALAALSAAAVLGADPQRGAAALAGFVPVAGRGAQRRIAVPGGTALLLDESYNASAIAVRAAFAVLALQPASRRVAVLGDMRELGEIGPAEHAGLADAARAADIVFTCGPLMEHLRAALPAARRGAHAPDSETLAPLVAAALRPGDAVLVKGSLGSRMRLVVDAIDHPPVADPDSGEAA